MTAHIWEDGGREKLEAQVAATLHDEFVYPSWMFALNIVAVAAFSSVITIGLIKFWKSSDWPYALIFAAFAAPVWKNLYEIYRGPRRWVVDVPSDTLSVERFDGTKERWPLSTLRRLPKGRLGRPYRIVDRDGTPAFEIWMYVSRYEELARLITPQT